jgi:hypothetical protein
MDTSFFSPSRNVCRETRGAVARLSLILVIFMLLGITPSFAQDARYAEIKELARDEFISDKQIFRLLVSDEGINLDCGTFMAGEEPGGAKMSTDDRLRFDTAIAVFRLEEALKETGYDLSGFSNAIETFEQNSLEVGRVASDNEPYIGGAVSFNGSIPYPYAALEREGKRQRRMNPNLPKFFEEPCGGNETAVSFDRPLNLRSAKLMRVAFLRLCALDIEDGTDPLKHSPNDCNWEPIAFGEATLRSGRYVIWSNWADGSCTASTQDVDGDVGPYKLEKTDRPCRQ